MVKSRMSNSNWRTIRRSLGLGLRADARCRLCRRTELRFAFLVNSPSGARRPRNARRPRKPRPAVRRRSPWRRSIRTSTSPGPSIPASYAATESPTDHHAKRPGTDRRAHQFGHAARLEPGHDQVSIRGQDGYEGNETLPGSNSLMRYPMQPSGDTTTQQSSSIRAKWNACGRSAVPRHPPPAVRRDGLCGRQ